MTRAERERAARAARELREESREHVRDASRDEPRRASSDDACVRRLAGPFPRARIAGSGAAYPEDLPECAATAHIDNAAACARLGLDAALAERAREQWGVALRGWVVDPAHASTAVRESALAARPESACGDELVADDVARSAFDRLSTLAARRALASAGASGEVDGIDALLLATSTRTQCSASQAARVGRALGLRCAAQDVLAGGSGFLYAWLDALGRLALGARRVLVIGCETLSPWLDPRDRASLLYGDAAGALLVERVDASTAAHADARDAARARADAPADSSNAPGGACFALLDRVDAAGVPFTVPGRLPPHALDVAARRYAFQAPDRAYRDALERAWDELALASRAEPSARGALGVPYAVQRAQVERFARLAGLDCGASLALLEQRGCVGAAFAPCALAALRATRGADGRTLVFASAAGGVARAALGWRDC